jgi:Na+/H+-dicarboxylate symporter
MKKLALHWKIIIGMVLGIIFGFIMNTYSGQQFVTDWVAPFGTIFINLLKLIAVPLILASLIKGISDLKDISKIKSMGLRTISIYIGTTLIAIISYLASFYYLFKVDNHNLWIFVVLLVFATMMLFSADSLISSLSKFIKNNEKKEI